MGRVTLLGASLATTGREFVFLAPCASAPTCPIAGPCQNLRLHKRYRVVARRDVHHGSCVEHEGGVQAVEVEERPLVANVPERSLRGTLVRWEPPVCNQRGCPQWGTCFDPALQAGAEYRVDAAAGAVACPMGYKLRQVQVSEGSSGKPRTSPL